MYSNNGCIIRNISCNYRISTYSYVISYLTFTNNFCSSTNIYIITYNWCPCILGTIKIVTSNCHLLKYYTIITYNCILRDKDTK